MKMQDPREAMEIRQRSIRQHPEEQKSQRREKKRWKSETVAENALLTV